MPEFSVSLTRTRGRSTRQHDLICRYRWDRAEPCTKLRARWIAHVWIKAVDGKQDFAVCKDFERSLKQAESDLLYDAAQRHMES